jgi:hypothetical protein
MIVRLAEDLPAGEQYGLAMQLRQVMVNLPAAIAYDLLEKDSHNRKTQTLHLVAMLDLIDKIYPALDTADLRAAVEKLADRLAGDKFGEQTAGAAAAYLPGAVTPATNEHPAAQPQEAAPSAVPVVPEAPAAPAPEPAEHTEAAPTKIAVTSDGTVVSATDHQENDVHTDSVK